MTEAMEITKLPPLWLGLAGALIVLAIASQWVRGARFAMHASIFFGIMAWFGWMQGWPAALLGQASATTNPVLGLAWLADVGFAGLFLVMAIALTLGRGRGGAVALLLALLVLLGGVGAKLGWWMDVLPWPTAPLPALTAPGAVLLAAGALMLLASIGCFIAQRSGAEPASYPEPPRQMPHFVLGAGHHGDDDEDEEDEHEHEHDSLGEEQRAPLLDHPWTPLRKRSIRRHRHRRATRHGH